MKSLILAVLTSLAVVPAVAEDVTTGQRGGFWCPDETSFEATIAGRHQDRKDGIGSSCELIKPTLVIHDAKAVTLVPGGVTGRADFMYGPDAFFMAYLDPREFKRVEPTDLMVAPEKWVGRPIELVGVSVYWIDEREVRILTGAQVMVVAGRVTKNQDAEFFARECATIAEAQTPKCRATVRFVFGRHEVERSHIADVRRRVLLSRDAELIQQR